MSRFTEFTSLQAPNKSSHLFTLLDMLQYEIGFEGSGSFILVPAGFKTDFATIPIILKAFFDPWDYRWVLAVILHDWLFDKATTLKEHFYANKIMSEAMRVCGSPEWIVILFRCGVSIGAIIYWAKKLIKRKFLLQ